MYLALPVSSGGFLRAIRVSKYSRVTTRKLKYFHVRDYHPLWCFFPEASINTSICNFPRFNDVIILQPQASNMRSICMRRLFEAWFGLIRFRSPLLTEYLLVSFPLGTEMFHFPRCASLAFAKDHRGLLDEVSPFRDLRIKGC